jgi:hypothetical protein
VRSRRYRAARIGVSVTTEEYGDQAFAIHELSPNQITELRKRFKNWAAELIH